MGYPVKRASTSRPLAFLMVDSADHLTGKTGLTPAVEISKNGDTFAAPAGSISELGFGWYLVAPNADDNDTFGVLLLHASAAGADPLDDRFEVVAFDPDVEPGTATKQTEILAAVTAGNTKLDAIGLKAALITAGRIRVLSRVVGATITAKAGDDHLAAAGNALTLEVDDDDASLFALLTDAGNSAVEFGAGRGSEADEITVTITADNVSHVGTQTFVEIPLVAASTSGKRAGEYAFDIQVTNAAGYKITPQSLEGVLFLSPDRKS